jgi:hypothetical protein
MSTTHAYERPSRIIQLARRRPADAPDLSIRPLLIRRLPASGAARGEKFNRPTVPAMNQSALVQMQQTMGNRAVQRLIARTVATASHSMVRQGSRGPDVVALQERLNELGSQLVADGDFGPKTHAAVVAFQTANGLVADGIVGPKTWAALGGSSAASMPPSSTTEEVGQGAKTADAGADEQAPPATPHGEEVGASGQRAMAVSLALAEAGKVEAYTPAGPDPETGKTTRLGWERLDEYFEVSYGGRGGQYNSIMQAAVKFHGQKLQSWCGHFAVWALKSAGVPLGKWKIGQGISSLTQRSHGPHGYTPQPGDVGYIDQPFQHHCIVVRVEGDTVITIDGNTRGEGGATGGQIAENSRPRSAFTAFFEPAFS